MRLCSLAASFVAVLTLLLLPGCGSGEPPKPATALGAKSSADVAAIRDFMRPVPAVQTAMQEIALAMTSQDVPAARSGAEALTRAVETMEAGVDRPQTPALRETLRDYVRPLRRLVDLYTGFVDYLEDPNGKADRAYEQRFDRETTEAFEASKAADRRLLDKLAEALPSDQRAEFERTVAARERQVQQANIDAIVAAAAGGTGYPTPAEMAVAIDATAYEDLVAVEGILFEERTFQTHYDRFLNSKSPKRDEAQRRAMDRAVERMEPYLETITQSHVEDAMRPYVEARRELLAAYEAWDALWAGSDRPSDSDVKKREKRIDRAYDGLNEVNVALDERILQGLPKAQKDEFRETMYRPR